MTKETTTPAAGKLTPGAARASVVDAAFVASVRQRPNHVLVDARAPVFYTGITPTMNGKAGHIPGAVNIPFTEITDNEQKIDRTRSRRCFERWA